MPERERQRGSPRASQPRRAPSKRRELAGKGAMRKHTILFLAPNPSGTNRVMLEQEARLIQEELERSGRRDCFELVTRWTMKPLDLLRELRKLKPTVVHFSGHGGDNGLFFHAEDGRAQLVSIAALVETFSAAGASVKLVVFDTCYCEVKAEAFVSEHVP